MDKYTKAVLTVIALCICIAPKLGRFLDKFVNVMNTQKVQSHHNDKETKT